MLDLPGNTSGKGDRLKRNLASRSHRLVTTFWGLDQPTW
jgi:hypothetical protein